MSTAAITAAGAPSPSSPSSAPSPGDCPTETLPAIPTRRPILRPYGAPRASAAPFEGWRGQAQTEELPACPRVSTSTRPTGSRVARHLRAALTGIALAVALLAGLQLYAAAGIADARQAALAEPPARRDAARTEQAEQAEQADAPSPQWTVEGTATEAPSPIGLPSCTTSPDTPLPCLATISPDSTRAVVLEEDASLTALVRR